MSRIDTKQPSALCDEIKNLIVKTRTSVYKEKPFEIFADNVLDTIISSAEHSEDYSPVKIIIQKYIQEMGSWQVILRDMLKQVEALEASRTLRELYNERWWQQKRKALYDAFQSNPHEGLDQWLQIYTEALIAWQLHICDKLTKEPFPFPSQAADFVALFQTGTQAIRDESYLEALDMLTYLIQAEKVTQPQPILDRISRAGLYIFSGRIFLYKSTDREHALRHFKRAEELASDDGRPHAALGDFYRVENDIHKALRLYRQAIERSPNQPDGYIGMGLIAEDQKQWGEADEWYKRAITVVQNEKDFDIGLRRFLLPSGNIYLYLARKFKNEDPERALWAVTYAISIGIKQDGNYPERIAYSQKGELLETLQRPTEAAEAYYEAGRRYSWQNEHKIAIDLLTKAKVLNPDHTPTFWVLSDSWRMLSYTPEPPYVDKDSIKQSIAIWENGAHIKLPDSDYYWSYTIRALINEQLARLQNADLWTLWWEAVVYLERAILLNKWDVYCLVYLGRFHHILYTESNALNLTHKALEDDPANLLALDERAAILVDVGKFNEAEEVIEKRQALELNDWTDALKASILLRKGQLEEALELINRVIKKTSTEIWYRELRALGYCMNNEPSRAQEDYRWIWNHYDPLDRVNQSSFGSAAYWLGEIDKAIEIFSSLRDDRPHDFFSIYCGLGECYFAKGDIASGEKNLNKAIAQAINVRQLDDLLKIVFINIQKVSIDWPHGFKVQEILEQLKEKIKTRRTELEQRSRSPEEELQQIVTKIEREDEIGSWAWIGANAGLARLYAEEKRWYEAETIYQLLGKHSDRFPEARLGLENIIKELQTEGLEKLNGEKASEAIPLFQQALLFEKELISPDNFVTLNRQLGDALLKSGRLNEALEQLTKTITIESISQDEKLQAELHSRLALCYFLLGKTSSAQTHYQEAIKLHRLNGASSTGSTLEETWYSLIPGPRQFWTLWDGLHSLETSPSINQDFRTTLADTRNALIGILDKLYGLDKSVNELNIPVVTPLVLEVGDDIVPKVDPATDGGKFLFEDIPEMRERIEKETGVKVTGVRARGMGSTGSRDQFVIQLDEVPVFRGSVKVGKVYCPASSEVIRQYIVPSEEIVTALNPWTDEEGCWFSFEYRDKIQEAGLELWPETLYMIYQLEVVLRRNLAHFLGIQEVEMILESHAISAEGAQQIVSVLPDRQSRLHFTRLLRTLVKENTPITNIGEILQAIGELQLNSGNLDQAVRNIRVRNKSMLPGNRPGVQRFELPLHWEEMADEWVRVIDGKTKFIPPPDKAHDLIQELARLVPLPNRNTVLVVRKHQTRPFLRRLLENRFPDLMVMSAEEFIEGIASEKANNL